MDFKKKFNIGLTLETNLSEFRAFIEEYGEYIHSFYFSPPLGSLYHTRSKVALEFLIPGKKKLFWQMLEIISSAGIELELLFNTLRLNEELIHNAKKCLDERGIEVNSVCFLRDYYEGVREYFPDKKYIWSFNNGFRSQREIDEVIGGFKADAFVLGSLFIRNNKFFEHLASRSCEPYLLLNNACSFNCDTCNNTQSICERAFIKNLEGHSVEYLYALQSIFPEELSLGIIDTTNIGCFKISNRSSNLKFIRGAMDSYITGRVREYVLRDKRNYAYWGRAGYFWKYFSKMDIDKIYEYKSEIFHKTLGGGE